MTLKLIRGHYIMLSGAVTVGSSKEADVRDTVSNLVQRVGQSMR